MSILNIKSKYILKGIFDNILYINIINFR